jgi:hypothetical protein
MNKLSALVLVAALSPALALAANANDAAPAAVTEVAATQSLLPPERIREILISQGAKHVSPLKRIGASDYEAKILTAEKGWNKVFIDGHTGKVIEDPMRGFRN